MYGRPTSSQEPSCQETTTANDEPAQEGPDYDEFVIYRHPTASLAIAAAKDPTGTHYSLLDHRYLSTQKKILILIVADDGGKVKSFQIKMPLSDPLTIHNITCNVDAILSQKDFIDTLLKGSH
ncbi:hypothetical protein CEXT_300951 [Caerostris extrusa]|uniref:Uncharacterized protein n=1 Tax=Caerostris extrusa TaxID=172846 RepID=A0AAV4MTM2_CAEEX|nr:hypothetical protein CEXT_300951 [Caerostris extrusa]